MILTTLHRSALTLGIVLMPGAAAVAAADLYLGIDTVTGEADDPRHPGLIDLHAFSWTAHVQITRGADGRRTFGTPTIGDIVWTQSGKDASVIDLFKHANQGNVLPTARFQLIDAAAINRAPSLVLEAGKPLINSLNFAAGSGGEPTVNASLSTAKPSLTFDPAALGGAGPALTTAYDAVLNESTGALSRDPTSGAAGSGARAGLYLRLGGNDGNRIAGDTKTAGYANWIAINEFSMGASSSRFNPDSPGGTVTVSELSWVQRLDATAPVVLHNLLDGGRLGQVTLEKVVISRIGNPVTVMQQAFNDVFFSSFELLVSGGGEAALGGSLSFGSYTQTNWLVMPDGSRSGPFSVGYDVDGGQAMPGALAADVVGFGRGNLDGSGVVDPAPIPEPQTWALLLAGLAGVLVHARRQRGRA